MPFASASPIRTHGRVPDDGTAIIDTFDETAWSALLLGLYTGFAGIGALRNPDTWRKMIDEVSDSPSLQLVTGLLELMLGAAV